MTSYVVHQVCDLFVFFFFVFLFVFFMCFTRFILNGFAMSLL